MQTSSNYQLIIFDWDGTLMDSREKIVNCFTGAAKDVDVTLPDKNQVISYIGLGLPESFRRLYPHEDILVINQLISRYREYWLNLDSTPMQFFQGVVEGLKRLQDAGYLLAIATGKSRRGLERVLCDTDLKELFVYSRCADEARSKPHPQMLVDILEYTGLQNKQCAMIGDTTYDLEMAQNAGMDGMGVGYGSHSKELLATLSVGPVFDRFDQLESYFSHLLIS